MMVDLSVYENKKRTSPFENLFLAIDIHLITVKNSSIRGLMSSYHICPDGLPPYMP
jgi:hypothetical protein